MQQNKRRVFIEAREHIPGGKRTTKRRTDGRTGALRQFKITLDRVVVAIDLRDAIVKPARAFARIAHSINFLRATDFPDQRAAQQSLKIKSKIGLKLSRYLQPRPQTARRTEAAKFAARKNVDMLDIGISTEQRGEFRIDHPGDFCIGMRIADQRDRGQSMHDIAERARFDDQYLFQRPDVRLSILSANRKSFRERRRQTGLDDFLLRDGDLIFHSPLLDDVVLNVINAVGGSPIAIAWLTDAAGIDEIFFARLDAKQLNADTSDPVVADKRHGYMSMPEETNGRVLISETRGRIEIIEDITPLCRCIERSVHDRKIAHLPLQAQVAQPHFVLRREMIACPKDRALGQLIEVARGFDQRGLFVMVAFDDGAVQIADAFDTLVRIGVVTDDVAQTDKVRAIVLMRLLQHGLERLEIGMNITENSETHFL